MLKTFLTREHNQMLHRQILKPLMVCIIFASCFCFVPCLPSHELLHVYYELQIHCSNNKFPIDNNNLIIQILTFCCFAINALAFAITLTASMIRLPAAERHQTTSMMTVISKLKKLANRKIIIYT